MLIRQVDPRRVRAIYTIQIPWQRNFRMRKTISPILKCHRIHRQYRIGNQFLDSDRMVSDAVDK